MHELGKYDKGLLANGRSGYLQHFSLSYYTLEVQKTLEFYSFGALPYSLYIFGSYRIWLLL